MELTIKPGDLLFVTADDLISRGIEAVTHGPCHVAMFIDQNTVCEAQGGRTVGECDLSFYLQSGAHLEVWSDPTLSDEERAQMVEYARTLYGTPYDYLLIPLELAHEELGLRLDWFHENKHLICSTYVEQIGWHVGRKWSQVPNPAPVDLVEGGVQKFKGVIDRAQQSPAAV